MKISETYLKRDSKDVKRTSATLHKKIKFSVKDFFSKCDQIRKKLRIWSHLQKKSLIENFTFCAVRYFSRVIYLNFEQMLLIF